MRQLYLGLLLLLSSTAMAHTQSPGLIEDMRIYKEVNSYEFTLVNRNDYTTSFNVLVGDYDPKTKGIINEKIVGTIEDLGYNKGVKFMVDLRVNIDTTREALMCTEMVNPNASYRSRVCSKVIMKRR